MKKNNLFNLILLISFAYFISSCGNTNSSNNDKSEQDIVGNEIELGEEMVEEIDTVDYKASVDMGTEVSNINDETVSQLRKKITITKSSSPSVLILGDSHLMGQFGENLHKNIHSLNIFDIMSISIGGAGSATYIYPLKNSCCGYSIRESLKDEDILDRVRRVEQCNYKSDEIVGKEYDGRLSNFVKEIMPEVVVIALGNNFNNSHQNLIDIIHGENPNSEIIWIGPMKRENLDKRIRAINKVVKDNSLFFVRSDDVIGSDTLTTAHFFGSEAKRWADTVFGRMRPVLESYEDELQGSTIQF